MQTKLKFALCIVNILINVTVISGCIYEKPAIQQQKEQLKEQIHKERTIETETDEEVDTQAIEPVSLGEFKLTAYCSCEICCYEYAYNRPIDKNGNEIVYGAMMTL